MNLNQLVNWWGNLTNRQQIAIGAFIILVAYLVFRLLGGQFNNSQQTTGAKIGTGTELNLFSKYRMTNWRKQGLAGLGTMNPAERLLELVAVLGPPAVFDPSAGGAAIWTKKQLQKWPFERIELRDEQIPSDSPIPHTKFLYSWYRLEVPKHKVDGLIRISQSLNYDPLTRLVQARCHDLKGLVVANWIARKYSEDAFTLDEAAGMYGPMVMELSEDDETGVKYQQLLSEL